MSTDSGIGAGAIQEVDVLIIGAGVVGLGLAYELSMMKSDLRILVLDKSGPGSGTSGRSAGVICRHDQGSIYQRLSLIGHSRMKSFEAQYGFEFNAWGSLDVVRSPSRFPPIRRASSEELSAAPSGLYVNQLLERDELLRKFPWIDPTGVLGGVFQPNVGFINPFELIELYRRLLAERGVKVDYGNPVLSMEVSDGRITRVTTRRGFVAAGTVVNAAGAWANKVAALAGSSVQITPQRVNVALASMPMGGLAGAPLHGTPGLHWEGDGIWCRGETGGTALFGQHRDKVDRNKPTADPDFFDSRADDGFAETIAEYVDRFYLMPRANVHNGWTCVYDTSDDGFPIVGTDVTVANLIHAVGMNGHGMTIHAGIARCITQLILHGSWEVDVSDVMPWQETLDFSILRPGRFADGEALALAGELSGK